MNPAQEASRLTYAVAQSRSMLTGAGSGVAGGPPAIEKPRIQQQLDQLDKVLAYCHETTSNIERAADRLLGCVPEADAKNQAQPAPNTVESRLAFLIGYAETLMHRLEQSANRLNSAV